MLRNLYYYQSTMCQAHKVLGILLCSHLLSCNHKHLRYPLMKSNSIDYFIKNEDSNSILLSSVHRWNSEVCTLTSILWIDKIPWTVTHASPWFHFHQMEILSSSMFHISWLKYVLIASLTRTDFKHRYSEATSSQSTPWTCYCNKSSFMDKTFLSVSVFSSINIR